MKNSKRKTFCRVQITLVILLLCMFTGCSANKSSYTYLDANSFTVNGEFLELPCKYGVLKYPAKWKQLLAFESKTQNSTNVITLYYCEGTKKAELANLLFGEGDGLLIGTIHGENVFVTLGDIQDDKWSESDVLNYCAMQEDVNELITHLSELDGFTTN